MTNSEKLARWQGWEPYDRGGWCSPNQRWSKSYPDYPNDDSAAMSLLDTLVEKGYAVDMASRGHKWDIGIARYNCDLNYCVYMTGPTRREAVVAAVLEMIGKEDV